MENLALKEKMYAHIEDWKTSGKSRAAYSAQLGITPKKFAYWYRKYQRERPDLPSHNGEGFISIETVPPAVAPAFQITYPNGVKLECPSPEGADRLRTLLTLLD